MVFTISLAVEWSQITIGEQAALYYMSLHSYQHAMVDLVPDWRVSYTPGTMPYPGSLNYWNIGYKSCRRSKRLELHVFDTFLLSICTTDDHVSTKNLDSKRICNYKSIRANIVVHNPSFCGCYWSRRIPCVIHTRVDATGSLLRSH